MDEELKKKLADFENRIKRIENYLSAFYSLNQPKTDTGKDDLYDEAVKLAISYGKVTSSLFQRTFQIGFNRAARLIEQLAENGIVEEGSGSKPRKVLIDKDYLKKASK